MAPEHEKHRLNPEERRFVKHLAGYYTPAPFDATQRAAFDRALEERLVCRSRSLFFRPAALVATACVMALLWFGTGLYNFGAENDRLTTVTAPENVPPADDTSLLTYAYYNAELYEDEDGEETEDFLLGEYEALDNALVVPEG
jgi:hypothetical protein